MKHTIDSTTQEIQQKMQDIAHNLETIETKLYCIHVRYVQLTTGSDALAHLALQESEQGDTNFS